MRWRPSLSAFLLAGLAAAATSIEVPGNGGWVDTGVDLRAGDQINFTATGNLTLAAGRSVGPEGQPRGFRDVLKSYLANDAGLGALIGRMSSDDTAIPFLIGPYKQYQSLASGQALPRCEQVWKRLAQRNLYRANRLRFTRT